MVERKLIVGGVLAGALAGLLAFAFARIFAEPLISKAIAYETARDAAQAVLDKAAGLSVTTSGPDLFSRTLQANVGIGVGMVAFGAAVGGAYAVTYTVCLGRVGNLRARSLALLVGLLGFLAVSFVPSLKYPANPPAIGHGETISQRGALYLTMTLLSVLLAIAAVYLGQRLQPRFGSWNATLLAGAAFAVAIGVVMAVLPALGHLQANRTQYGDFATETPQPLKDASGTIVFPGFDADLLFSFRLYSVAAQAILWGGLSLLFAPGAQRILAPSAVQALPRQA